MSIQSKSSRWSWIKAAVLASVAMGLFYTGYANAGTGDIGSVASTLTTTFASVAKMVTAMSYLIGMGFGVSAMLKFKAHKDNPQGTPLGVPMMLLFVAAGLLFLPSIFSMGGASLGFSSVGGITGVNTFG
jgi:intracellular multiplication protein IcmD